MKIKKAVIPAAGLGTRILPATKAQPKEMLPIVDKPAIQYIVEEACKQGSKAS
jgi:UTP--glucose-1-phosphate uridylyltransferase